MTSTRQPNVVIRRADRPGDLGWVVMAHGEVYDEQYGWNTDFEALVARIVADYAADHDPGREAAWIAEVDGTRAGSVFLVSGDDVSSDDVSGADVSGDGPTMARLRILLVTPAARGLGLGTRLVGECLRFARDAGYRTVTLWTNDILTSARKIYQSYGFVLVNEDPHRSFGHQLVGQTWTLDLLP